MFNRRQLLSAGTAVLAAPFVLRAGRAQDAEFNLKLHHFLGPKAPAQTKMLEPWAERDREGFQRPREDRDLSVDVARRHAAAARSGRCATASSTSSGP